MGRMNGVSSRTLTCAEWCKGGFVAYHPGMLVPSLGDEFAGLLETVLACLVLLTSIFPADGVVTYDVR